MKAKKGEVIHKLKIARGQIDGILQMIEEDRYCVWTYPISFRQHKPC